MITYYMTTLAHWAWVPVMVMVIYKIYQQYLEHRSVVPNFPIVDEADFSDWGEAMVYGSNKYKDQPFQILGPNDSTVILPISYFPETEQIGGATISLTEEVRRRFLGRWTHLGMNTAVIETVRKELTRNVDKILSAGIIADETAHSMDTEIGRFCTGDGWTPIPVFAKMLSAVSMISGRIFVGLPLCRDKEWIDISVGYTLNAVATTTEASRWKPFLRPLVAPFLPSVRRCREQRRKMAQWMRPLLAEVRARQQDEKQGAHEPGAANGERGKHADLEARGTFVSWLMNHIPESSQTEDELSIGQILISFASIHTTSTTTSMALYDLACRPQLAEELREEIEDVARRDDLKKNRNGIAVWPKQSMAKLWKLDSFVKESQRMNPLAFATPVHRVMAPVTFSTGLHLPKHARLCFPSWAIHTSPSTPAFSPLYNSGTGNLPPDQFDPLRFYRLRLIEGRERKHQVVTTSCESLNFGHGHHACPGRFFATYEIKYILMAIITGYDIRFPGDDDNDDEKNGKGREELRPENIKVGMAQQPNPRGLIEFRKRQV
ncbi:hypothetical protein MKZ38_002651 [Zalerion maritima]|uniref:Cytochrome P450 n=1 Tax=Zalerion maritima TaxID=339359 RepID=A0AAD5WWT5_9PEZI|nr:hypothetical protein MKZ38_002651 [Zalerion maritima]